MNMIELRGVTKRFDGFAALSSLDLTVPQGAVYGLIGPNGAGKTTVFNLLTKIYQPTRGTILLDGRDTHSMSTVQIRPFVSCGLFGIKDAAISRTTVPTIRTDGT